MTSVLSGGNATEPYPVDITSFRRGTFSVFPGLCATTFVLALTFHPVPLGAQAPDPQTPETPRIMSVRMSAVQPQESAASTIWYDDFSADRPGYTEKQNEPDLSTGFGGQGGSLGCFYATGSQGTGNRKVFFGDSPTGTVIRPGERFDEVYWRVYVKHQYGWTGGGPAKMSRVTSIVNSTWSQAMISHVWSSGEALTLDPVRLVEGDRLLSTKYNDFDNMKWLGNRPASDFKISSAGESGWWVCVEASCRLNTPGLSDGETRLWIDGRIEAERTGLDFRGSYTGHSLNALFLEAYWNNGSPVDQWRWYDNFVISTEPIGPVTAPRNPTLYKMPYHGPGTQQSWQVELASATRETVLWRAEIPGASDSVAVDATNGEFLGGLAGKVILNPGALYRLRVRQQSSEGAWSEWSRWHQQFLTEGEPGQGSLDCDLNGDGRETVFDVLWFMLFQRNNPEAAARDYNGDGRTDVKDAYCLLRDIIAGRSGLSALSLASASNASGR